MKVFLAMLVVLALVPPARADTYKNYSGSFWAYNPEAACYLGRFYAYEYRRGQWFYLTVYPNLTLRRCSGRSSAAQIGARFRSFKVTGDRREGCRGSLSLDFNYWGEYLKVTKVIRGSEPGRYCRDIGKVSEFYLRRR